jgi:hypothetical protein
MTPQEFEERFAADRLERLEQWRIGGLLAAQIENAATTQIMARAGKCPTEADMREPQDFMPLPQWLREQREKSRYLSDDEVLANLSRMM